MFKIFNTDDLLLCSKLILIISITLFLIFQISAPAKAATIEMVGCDVGFDRSIGKPKVNCTNPRFTKEEMRAFENL